MTRHYTLTVTQSARLDLDSENQAHTHTHTKKALSPPPQSTQHTTSLFLSLSFPYSSPMATDTTALNAERTTVRRTSMTQLKPKQLRPFDTAEVKILLLENVNETAVKAFQKQGYQVNKKNKRKCPNIDASNLIFARWKRTARLWWAMSLLRRSAMRMSLAFGQRPS